MNNKTKSKTKRSPKQSKQKLVKMMRELEKSSVSLTPTKSPPGTCIRIYCF